MKDMTPKFYKVPGTNYVVNVEEVKILTVSREVATPGISYLYHIKAKFVDGDEWKIYTTSEQGLVDLLLQHFSTYCNNGPYLSVIEERMKKEYEVSVA